MGIRERQRGSREAPDPRARLTVDQPGSCPLPGPMRISFVRSRDADALARLFGSIDTTHFRPHPMTPDSASSIARYDGPDVYLVGWIEGTAIAYGMLRGWDEGYDVPSLGIAVRADHYRHGHATAMMDALHEVAAQRGSPAVRLRVSHENEHARRLYEALGYEDVGEERGERLMVLDLDTRDR